MKIKVCGITRQNDLQALSLSDQPVDFVGFVFYPPSPRYVAHEMPSLARIPKGIATQRVGVFVNESLSRVEELARSYAFQLVQLHGQESAAYCQRLRQSFRVIKAFNVDAGFDFETLSSYASCCDYFLFDARGKLPGGNRIAFDWSLLQKYRLHVPFFLSGGISPVHTRQLLSFSHPSFFGVDINSGFEIAPGSKDIQAIRNFVKQLRQQV
ncbi:MAG: N-(5'-phosphoribosyl)anthranilate isomerase [Chitinophagales bacterium]|nr:MAG: N-(5'-phosphoribosyl)anthranilate isomerase [Chitinophagales bacterium]